MTAIELGKFVGKQGTWQTGYKGVAVDVKVTDAREIFGRVDLQVEPCAGSGRTWVDSQFVTNLH